MQLTKNFSLKEFDCSDGTPVPDFVTIKGKTYPVKENIKKLAEQLEILRTEINSPLFINSGFRTVEYNKKVGGVSNSQHLYGIASDVRSTKFTPLQLSIIVEKMISEGKLQFKGLGLYDTFIHLDLRKTKSRWDFRKHK